MRLSPPRLLHEVEPAADRREHPQREAVHFQDAEFVEVVLVPLHDRAALHGGGLDRHEVAEIPAGHHHAADVLAEVAGKADELADERREPRAGVARGVEPRLSQPRRQILAGIAHVVHGRDRVDAVEREAERLGVVADGRPQPVADHLGGHRRPGAAIGFVDVLDHLLAAVVFEVDVDVGSFPAFAAHEPLEEHIHPRRIHRRDPEAVADAGVGCRAPSLAEDAAAAGEPHDVEHREEVGLVAELGDE